MSRMRAAIIAVALTGVLGAQSAKSEIQATGEHTMAAGDTADSARQLALVEAHRNAVAVAIRQLQDRPDVRSLRLQPIELEALTAVILEPEVRPAAPERTSASVVSVQVVAQLDADEAVRRIAALRKDVDATRALADTRRQTQQLHQQLADQTRQRSSLRGEPASTIVREQLRIVTALNAKQMAARSMAALARTEDATIGGRAPSPEGRQRARQLAEAAIAISADSPDAHSVMGDVLADAGRLEEAEAEYRKALLADNSSPRRTKLAEALRLQGKFDEAVAELQQALKSDARFAQAHSDLGMILRAQGKLSEAIVEYREAVRLDPDSTDAHNGLAIAFANAGNLEAAVTEFREIVRIDPDSAIGYYNLATALANLDRDGESAAALREVIRINPNHYNAHYNLGELFRLEGKYDESAKQFREYLRLAPDTPQNRRNIERAKSFVTKFSEQ